MSNVIQFPQAAPDTQIHVSISASGMYDICDHLNLRGGRFIDHKSAFRFIRHEFGPHAKLVYQSLQEAA